jgi:enterochelin esterase family protein
MQSDGEMAAELSLSPRLAALRREWAAGDPGALGAFWAEVETTGAPLVEPVGGDDTHVLVTFLWRAAEPMQAVAVLSSFGGWDAAAPATHLTRLGATDVWYRTFRARADHRASYTFSLNDPPAPTLAPTSWSEHLARRRPDPRNPRHFTVPPDDEAPAGDFRGYGETLSVVELPQAPPGAWITPRPDVPHGLVRLHRLDSAHLGSVRRVWVYTPPGYADDCDPPCGLLLLFDGFEYLHYVCPPTILDNLLAAGRIPLLVAVMFDSPSAVRAELGCAPHFAEFLVGELLPWLRQHYHVTDDPRQTIVAGASLGGVAAAYAGLRHPETFGNVLAQSGAFWWPVGDDPEPEWLARQFAAQPVRPLRFHLSVGLREIRATANDGPNLLAANRHLRTVLWAKGYSVDYVEYMGGHDWLCWRAMLPDGIMALCG